MVRGANARTCIFNCNRERTIGRCDLDRNFPGIGELDRVAGKIEEDLGKLLLITAGGRHVGPDIHLEIELLFRRQRLDRTNNVIDDILDRVVGKGKF